jgi:hypothetical protein
VPEQTSPESAVLWLVVEGVTNREAAKALFTSSNVRGAERNN